MYGARGVGDGQFTSFRQCHCTFVVKNQPLLKRNSGRSMASSAWHRLGGGGGVHKVVGGGGDRIKKQTNANQRQCTPQ